jgi:hypothetical protein
MKMLLPPGASGVWTIEEIQGQVQQLTHTLPMPEMQPGKVIKLAGQGGIFNTIPPINESWLEGRITNEEWTRLISSINDVVCQSYIGKPKGIHYINGQLQGEDPYQRAYAAIAAYLPSVQAWWKQNRGVNLHFQALPQIHNRSSRHSSTILNPVELFVAILDPPPQGTNHSAPPPVYVAAAMREEGQMNAAPEGCTATVQVQPARTQ